jgi:hypothetical protein
MFSMRPMSAAVLSAIALILLSSPVSTVHAAQSRLPAPQPCRQGAGDACDQWLLRTHLGGKSGVSEFLAITQQRASMEFNPRLQWVQGGRIRYSEQLDSDAEFAGARELQLDGQHRGVIVAFHFAGDRSGTWYRVYGVVNGQLKLLQEFQVVEGQLDITEDPSGAMLRIWQEAGPCKAGEAFCVWCLHRYRLDQYRWGAADVNALQTSTAAPKALPFYLLSRLEEPGCRDPKQLYREPIVGVPAPKVISHGIEGEP